MSQEGHEKNAPRMNADEHEVIRDIRAIISQARSLTRRSVNSLQVISNYLIGKRLVDSEPQGKDRAGYGKETLKQLSAELTQEFGRGYSATNLEYMRKFYRTYHPRISRISQTASETSSVTFTGQIPQTVSEELSIVHVAQTLSAQLPLSLSLIHI